VREEVLEVVGGLLYEALLVADDVRVVKRGEDADLVEGILLLALVEVVQLNLLYSIDLVVDQSLGAVHARVSPLPCFKR
jgi:hypothetical protein